MAKRCRLAAAAVVLFGFLTLSPPPPAAARPDRTIHVLIAADEEFRSLPGWETRAREALTWAATPFYDDFGLRLEAGRVVAWTSTSNDYDLAALHDEVMSKVDPEGADLVIAFTGDASGDEPRHLVKLGHSDTPGSWIVVTARAGAELPIVLRHELGHAFGVPHVRNVPSLMNEDVRSGRSEFDPLSAAIIRNNAGIDFRNADPFAGCPLAPLEAIYDELASEGNPVADLVALVGDSHRRRGEPDRASRAYRRALELDPELLNAKLGLGMLAMTGRRFTEAVQYFEAVRGTDPRIPGLDMNLGIAYAELGQAGNATLAYGRAIAADPGDAAAMNNLALLLVDSGDMARAEQLFRQAIDARPRFMEAFNNLGMLYEKEDRVEDAIRTFQSALQISESAVTHRNLATLLLRQGRRSDAKQHLDASLRLDPDQADSDQLRTLSRRLR